MLPASFFEVFSNAKRPKWVAVALFHDVFLLGNHLCFQRDLDIHHVDAHRIRKDLSH
jgi:hypothetical protein